MFVTLHTNHGDIRIELFAEQAPKTAANFVKYAESGFYENTLFHRVISDFMIQGGGFTPGMEQKPTDAPIENEANNGVSNERGTISMARTQDPHSATSQFFINVKDNKPLDFTGENPYGWGYCVFGKVVEGMDVVDSIRDVDTGRSGYHADVPVEDVVIKNATVEK
ncbi:MULTISPECIES: peptidylprolyl isomerase [Gammaproteobacteria]|uniref:peptidylprolyl isomerase n=1 Tax=Gammaproteobacteria TaxID=1236 RepID=UPI000DCFC669|nr:MULTISPECIES: peptidylprolyl isomerase [Gammaproteobacteria]RTE86848.1 peptidyl-prolyl cis-trans isomerase [Aliidiomarina sp. B3213]TCZ93363.1 peptidyl-prolyl cis-trans isomerase [Lysobacter sp. N42]